MAARNYKYDKKESLKDSSNCKTLQAVKDRKIFARYEHILQANYSSVLYEDVWENFHVHKFSEPLNDLDTNNLTDKNSLEKTLKRNQNTGLLKLHKNQSDQENENYQIVSGRKENKKNKILSDSQKCEAQVKIEPREFLQNDSCNSEAQVKIEPREFLQNDSCNNISQELPHCSECLMVTNPKVQYSYCSFINFRKLYISANGKISHLGFLEPADSNREDEKIWLPQSDNPPKVLTIKNSAEILFYLGSLLCDIIKQEEEGINMHIGSVQTRTWKKFICDTHDSCNVCGALIFNIHWVCPLCAFCVCINCYKDVKEKTKETESKRVAKFNCSQCCNNNEQHKLETLLMTQLIPEKILEIINYTMHIACKWCRINGFRMEDRYSSVENDMPKNLRKRLCNNPFSSKGFASEKMLKYNQVLDSRLMEHLEPNVLLYTNDNPKTCNVINGPSLNQIYLMPPNFTIGFENFDLYDPVPYKFVIEHIKKCHSETEDTNFNELPFLAYSKDEDCQNSLTIPMCVVTQSLCGVEDIPHMWLNHRKLLLLYKTSMKHFQDQWKQHLPIIVAGVHKQLVSEIWHPNVLVKIRSSIINCKTGKTVRKMRIKDYWMDFAHNRKEVNGSFEHRLPLKLKEWPAVGSFHEALPQHFENIMEVLPMPEYTAPDGVFNLASRLPTDFIQPDFGPKIGSAYGLDIDANCGTTSLCLSVADTVNILVYASSATVERSELYSNSMNQIVKEIGRDWITKRHILCEGVIPGALWHIYDILDVRKIRKFLSEIAAEEGRELKDDGDILQNNDWYLNKTYNERLSLEYGVEAHTIIQCLGDAVFIPAGVPYQVCNLYNCINVKKTFLSPESVANSLELVKASATLNGNLQETMSLSHIVYHSVKDVLSCLLNKTLTDQNKDKASLDSQELRTLNELSKVKEKINSPLHLFFNGLDE